MCSHEASKVSCAVLIIQKYALNEIDDDQAIEMNDEVAILLEHHHPNVTRMIAVQETAMNIYCIMELIPKGNLEALILAREHKLLP